MLNRVKKNLIAAAITGTLCLGLPSFALDSTISYININNLAYQDVEIVLNDKNEILVPFKQLADLFEIKYEANRADKQISFTTFDGKQGMITQAGVFVEDAPITKQNPVFIGRGIMEGVFNEAYIPSSVVEKIMGVTLETNFEDLTLIAKVDRDLQVIRNATPYEEDEKAPKAYQDVVSPKKSGPITLKTIGFRDNLQNDRMGTKYYGHKSSNTSFVNQVQQSANGDFFGGKYRIEVNEYSYKNEGFKFGGLTATYRNKFKAIEPNSGRESEYFYELGKVRGISDEDAQLGTQIFGGQVWNYDNEKTPPNRINGYVKPTSLVRLTVNDLEPVMLSTYAGYYTLRDVQLPNPVKKIKLEEINEDGSVELISEERYSIYGNGVPLQHEMLKTAYAGVWGYQNRLFRDGQNIYRGTNKKVTGGAEVQYGVSDNTTFKSKLSADKIYEKNNTNVVYRVPTNDSLLVTGTQKSVNYMEGLTSLNSMEWKNEKNKGLKARVVAGLSAAKDIRDNKTHGGYMGQVSGEFDEDLSKYKAGIFKPKRVRAKAEAFHTSPDWYIASTDSNAKNDRTGGKLSGGFGFNSTSMYGSYSKYKSNHNHRYRGGTLTFQEGDFAATSQIPRVADLRFNTHYKRGENDLGRNKNYNYEANISREFGVWAKLQAGRSQSVYDTKYHQQTVDDRNYYSKYVDNYAQLDVPIPRNLGKFTFGHDIIQYKTNNYKNDYNMMRFVYTFPTWHRFTPSVGWGFRYHGQGGNDFSAGVSYRARSGQTMNFAYQYSKNGGFFVDNMFTPSTHRHSIYFSFNDAFQIFNRGFRSVGSEDATKGLFEVIAFVDVNGNGKFDKKIDVPMKDIPLIANWLSESNITNNRGRVYSQSVEEGVYTVTLDMDNLPITVAPISNDKIVNKVKISGGQTTKLEIPLVSTVGSVSGVLKISDEFDRNLRISDFVVVLLDQNGNEVNYSTVDDSGAFYISGLAPGNYTLQLDERFISAYGLEEGMNSRINIVIPYDYNNPTDLMNQDLEYRTLSL